MSGSSLEGSSLLERHLESERDRVEQALERAVDELAGSLATELRGAVRAGVLSGGKRIRPVLCTTAYVACGGAPSEAVYDLAVSLELIHAYSLMHDDLPCMDDAELRRGVPTPHTVYGEGATMVAGALLIPAAAFQVWRAAGRLQCDPETCRELVRTLMRAAGAGGMVGGQALDLLAEGRRLQPGALDDLHRRKTGALLTAPLRMGALAAGSEEPTIHALGQYGRSIGLAFQITDDVLDVTGTAGQLGKNPSDVALAKSTYVSLFGLDRARELAREQIDKAVAALDSVSLEAPELRALAEYIVSRQR